MSNTVIETFAAGGLLRVRARARPLPEQSAEALEGAAAAIAVLRRAADARAAAVDAVVQEALDTLREGLAAGADSAKVRQLVYAWCCFLFLLWCFLWCFLRLLWCFLLFLLLEGWVLVLNQQRCGVCAVHSTCLL